MSAFDETSRYLKALLRCDYLHHDAKSDLEFMLRLHTTRDYHLDRFSPIVLVYPFLVNPSSQAGRVLRSLLGGYSGDLFQELAVSDASNYRMYTSDHPIMSAVPYPFENDCLRQASMHLGEPLHSGDLLTALLICPVINPFDRFSKILRETFGEPRADKDFEKDAEIYRLLREGQSIPLNMISKAHSEIAAFLLDRAIDPSVAAMALRGYGELNETDNIASRYSLVMGILPTGYLKVQILDGWGRHELAESHGVMSAPYGLLVPENVLFRQNEIAEFEKLLNANPAVPEEAYQEFFEAFPKWLYLIGDQYEEYRSQVRLPPLQLSQELILTDEPVDKMWLKPDFLLKRLGLDLWDVLDIKASDCRMIVGTKSRNRFSAGVSEAVAQLREYSRRLQQNEVRSHLKQRYGMNISEPVAMILVGRDLDFPSLSTKARFNASGGVRVYTYDHLHRLAKHRSLALAEPRRP